MVKAEEKKQYKQLECSVPFGTQQRGEDKYNNNKTEHKELREGRHKNGDISSTLKSPGERVAVSVGHGRTCIRNSHPILCMHQTARAGGRGAIRGVSSALRPAFPHHGRLTTGNSITTLALRERVATDAGFHPDPEDLANGDENDGAAILSFLVHLRQESLQVSLLRRLPLFPEIRPRAKQGRPSANRPSEEPEARTQALSSPSSSPSRLQSACSPTDRASFKDERGGEGTTEKETGCTLPEIMTAK